MSATDCSQWPEDAEWVSLDSRLPAELYDNPLVREAAEMVAMKGVRTYLEQRAWDWLPTDEDEPDWPRTSWREQPQEVSGSWVLWVFTIKGVAIPREKAESRRAAG